MLTYVLSVLALVTSMGSLGVSVLTYRTAGPKVTLTGHSFSFFPSEAWLQIKIVNSGKGEIDIDGATCDLLGPTVTVLPYRLKAAASHLIVFRAVLSAELIRSGSVTVNVGLDNGRNLISQVRMTEIEQADLRRLQPAENQSTLPIVSWLPPAQEEL
ncbi:MAG: hypothetical protein ACRDRX_27390 [Pseudonocardiaceae bacterium]